MEVVSIFHPQADDLKFLEHFISWANGQFQTRIIFEGQLRPIEANALSKNKRQHIIMYSAPLPLIFTTVSPLAVTR